MTDFLLDTGILIRHLRNVSGFPELLRYLADQSQLYIAVFTRFEIMRGMRERERKRTLDLLEPVVMFLMDAVIADSAGGFVNYWRQRGIVLGDGDAIIAAIALQHNLELVTTNPRHFPIPELAVWQADDTGKISRWQPT